MPFKEVEKRGPNVKVTTPFMTSSSPSFSVNCPSIIPLSGTCVFISMTTLKITRERKQFGRDVEGAGEERERREERTEN